LSLHMKTLVNPHPGEFAQNLMFLRPPEWPTINGNLGFAASTVQQFNCKFVVERRVPNLGSAAFVPIDAFLLAPNDPWPYGESNNSGSGDHTLIVPHVVELGSYDYRISLYFGSVLVAQSPVVLYERFNQFEIEDWSSGDVLREFARMNITLGSLADLRRAEKVHAVETIEAIQRVGDSVYATEAHTAGILAEMRMVTGLLASREDLDGDGVYSLEDLDDSDGSVGVGDPLVLDEGEIEVQTVWDRLFSHLPSEVDASNHVVDVPFTAAGQTVVWRYETMSDNEYVDGLRLFVRSLALFGLWTLFAVRVLSLIGRVVA
ncbi:MAG: hypothetical protein AAFP90_12435, partial [Planctomycetota bacterium]